MKKFMTFFLLMSSLSFAQGNGVTKPSTGVLDEYPRRHQTGSTTEPIAREEERAEDSQHIEEKVRSDMDRGVDLNNAEEMKKKK